MKFWFPFLLSSSVLSKAFASSHYDCPPVYLDFDEDGLEAGSFLYDEWWTTRGIKVTARARTNDKSKKFTPVPTSSDFSIPWKNRYKVGGTTWSHTYHNNAGGAARVFDTNNPTCDPDLGSPNEKCPNGGPGVGKGGGPDRPFPNCPGPRDRLNNVLIIQEEMKDCPDDAAGGGWITFDFNTDVVGPTGVQFVLAKFLDIDDYRNPSLKFWTVDQDPDTDDPAYVGETQATGNNGLFPFTADFERIIRVEIFYPSSGSIAEIGFVPSICSCPEVYVDFNDLVPESFLYDEWWNSKGFKVSAKADTTDTNRKFTPIPTSSDPSIPWYERYKTYDGNKWTWDYNLHVDHFGAARVFDTTNPTCDYDLGSPNESCGGPGVGRGGAVDSYYANCPSVPIGNVLIIQEAMKDCPDDTAVGGWIRLLFNLEVVGAVEITEMTFIDIDDGRTNPRIKFWRAGDDLSEPPTGYDETERTGENGLFPYTKKWRNLEQVEIHYPGSGCLAGFKYIPSSCPHRRLHESLMEKSDVRLLRSPITQGQTKPSAMRKKASTTPMYLRH